ncbi:MAG: hypothetical protein AAF390_01395 [Pseudomonadota bacterium]
MAAALAATPIGPAQSEDLSGTITYAGDAPIPKGRLLMRVEGTAARDHAGWTALTRGDDAHALAFDLETAQHPTVTPRSQVIVHLERPDGWLIARGSTTVEEADGEVRVVLYPVAY